MFIPRQQAQAYAPTPYSYTPNTALSATISLDEEVKLAETRAERDLQDSLAEVFSIITTIDALEKAFLKDAIKEAEYTETCDRLLKQYKAILTDDTVAGEFVDLETFKAKWEMEVPRATERIRIGLPSTVTAPSHNSTTVSNNSSGLNPTLVMEATQEFITTMDGLKLGLLTKDNLHGLLGDTIQAINRVTTVDFEGRGKIIQWLITLNQLKKATDEITEDQAREMLLDIDAAYRGFKSILN